MPKSRVRIKDRELLSTLDKAMAQGALSFGDTCRVLRAAKGWTQEQLAQRAGLGLKVVKQVEAGEGNPTLDSLQRLGKLAGLQVGFYRAQATVRIGSLDGYSARHAARTDLHTRARRS
jgi:transcriptional regulator with XRE-family HTH domain